MERRQDGWFEGVEAACIYWPFVLHSFTRNSLGEKMQTKQMAASDRSIVLGKATTRAAAALNLSNAAISRVIGLSEPTISRVVAGARGIDPNSKEGQLALLLVRLFRSLDPLVGSDEQKRVAWLRSHNKALNGTPTTLIETPQGLSLTLAYLDGMRAAA
jgi:hypothetical protein